MCRGRLSGLRRKLLLGAVSAASLRGAGVRHDSWCIVCQLKCANVFKTIMNLMLTTVPVMFFTHTSHWGPARLSRRPRLRAPPAPAAGRPRARSPSSHDGRCALIRCVLFVFAPFLSSFFFFFFYLPCASSSLFFSRATRRENPPASTCRRTQPSRCLGSRQPLPAPQPRGRGQGRGRGRRRRVSHWRCCCLLESSCAP